MTGIFERDDEDLCDRLLECDWIVVKNDMIYLRGAPKGEFQNFAQRTVRGRSDKRLMVRLAIPVEENIPCSWALDLRPSVDGLLGTISL